MKILADRPFAYLTRLSLIDLQLLGYEDKELMRKEIGQLMSPVYGESTRRELTCQDVDA